MRSDLHDTVWTSLNFVRKLFVAATMLWVGYITIPMDSWAWLDASFGRIHQKLEEMKFVLFILVGIHVFLEIGMKWIGPPKIWRLIHGILNAAREYIYSDEERKDSHVHKHRITLYQFKKWRFSWKGPRRYVLIPVERSGDRHLDRRSTSIWKMSDNPSECEGIAGKAWGTGRIVIVPSWDDRPLPDIHSEDQTQEIDEYVKRTNCSTDWVISRIRSKKTIPRSLISIPVEVNGKQWGVLVFDSMSETIGPKSGQNKYPWNKLILSVVSLLSTEVENG